MELKELKKEIPFKWRVQSFSKSSAKAQCVAYIDARDVMELLDEVCSPENWKDEYKEIDGKLFAGISIKVNDEWVTKWDTGSESNIEKEKGEVSDSFKRASVKWGVGRFLYAKDIVFVNSSEAKRDGNYPYVVDESGKKVWNITKFINEGGNKRSNKVTPKKAPIAKPKIQSPEELEGRAGKAREAMANAKDLDTLDKIKGGLIKVGFDKDTLKELQEELRAKMDEFDPIM